MKLKRVIAALISYAALAVWPVAAEEGQSGHPVFFVVTSDQAQATNDRLELSGDVHVTWAKEHPGREAGTISGSELVKTWQVGPNSFQADPPNAILTGAGSEGRVQAVVELTSSASTNDDLSFTYKLLHGQIPAQISGASLFIDGGGCGMGC
ncbi:MAG: hypothetical protein AAGA50_20500 [Pseudomonadota bacterium]